MKKRSTLRCPDRENVPPVERIFREAGTEGSFGAGFLNTEALYQMDALAECLRTADIVAACLPGTEETYHIFDRNAFAKMKKGAYFLNVGRGNAVDSYALAEALNSGHLAGASVDVTEPEPLPKEHPLWDAKNLLITPHTSGNYHLQETHERIIQIAADNLARFMQGRELRNIVDFATGYRKL